LTLSPSVLEGGDLDGAPAEHSNRSTIGSMPSPVRDLAELLDVDELTPGKAKKDITTLQAKKILASVRPRDLAGKTRRRLAAEQLADLVVVDKKTKALTKELKAMSWPPAPG
jgi:hypothetical protein